MIRSAIFGSRVRTWHVCCVRRIRSDTRNHVLWWIDSRRYVEDKVSEDKVSEDKVSEDKVSEDKVSEDKVSEDKVKIGRAHV